MKVNPYLCFNGNCAEAVALYEKAFKVKAVMELNEENLVGHAEFKIGGDDIMLFDAPQPIKVGDNIMISVRFDEAELAEATATFDTLAEGGQVIMPLAETAWSKCFGLLVDQFGTQWNLCQK